MSTRTVTVSKDERDLLLDLLTEKGAEVDNGKLLTRPDSPEEDKAETALSQILALIGKLM